MVLFPLGSWAGIGLAMESDISEVEKGSPTQIEDAYPLAYKELDVEGLFRYERMSHENRYVFNPRLEYGFAPNWQGRLTAQLFTGTADVRESGNLQAEILRSFTTERRWIPALAVSVVGDFPTGHAARGIDTTLKMLASKSLGVSIARPQAHVNVTWTHHGGRAAVERPDFYGVVVGYSRLLTEQMMIVADYFHQQLPVAGRTEDVIELGFRHALFKTTVIALGAGYGLNNDSRDLHVQTSIEVTFR
jgi:hypothetical protein